MALRFLYLYQFDFMSELKRYASDISTWKVGSVVGGASHSQCWTHTNKQQHPQGDALVQIPVLHSHSHHQSPHKQQVSVLKVLHTHLGQQGHKERVCFSRNSSLMSKTLHTAAVVLLTSLDCIMPNRGKRRAGRRAVMANGRTSVHQ